MEVDTKGIFGLFSKSQKSVKLETSIAGAYQLWLSHIVLMIGVSAYQYFFLSLSHKE